MASVDWGFGNDSSSSFTTLTQAFAQRIQELKKHTQLRIEDDAKGMYLQDLVGLEASVRALEGHVAELKTYIDKEREVIPKIEALLDACSIQGSHLRSISANLPIHLPGNTTASATTSSHLRASSSQPLVPGSSILGAASVSSSFAGDDAAGKRKREPAPRWYITERELNSVSSYMRGRLTLDKFNAAIDEVAAHAESNHRLVVAVRKDSSKVPPADRRRGTELFHSVVNKEGIKGLYFFLETDLKDGGVLKMDRTGKSILTVLRHLGRLQEVRVAIEGTPNIVYVLQPQA